MIEIAVTRMGRQEKDGTYPVFGFRTGDPLMKEVVFKADRKLAEELTRLAALATAELVIEGVQFWAFTMRRLAA